MERTTSSSSTSTSSSYPTPAQTRRHPASLLPKFMHDPALLELVRSPVTPEMICKYKLFYNILFIPIGASFLFKKKRDS